VLGPEQPLLNVFHIGFLGPSANRLRIETQDRGLGAVSSRIPGSVARAGIPAGVLREGMTATASPVRINGIKAKASIGSISKTTR